MLSFLRPQRERKPEPELESQPEPTESLDPQAREALLWELKVRREGAGHRGYDPSESPLEARRRERLQAGDVYGFGEAMKQHLDDTPERERQRAARLAAEKPERDRLRKEREEEVKRKLPQEAAAMADVMKERLANNMEKTNKDRVARRLDLNVQRYEEERRAIAAAGDGGALERGRQTAKSEYAKPTPMEEYERRKIEPMKRATSNELSADRSIGTLEAQGPAEILEEDDISTEDIAPTGTRPEASPSNFDLIGDGNKQEEVKRVVPLKRDSSRKANVVPRSSAQMRRAEALERRGGNSEFKKKMNKLAEIAELLEEDQVPEEEQQEILTIMDEFIDRAEAAMRQRRSAQS